MLGQLAGQVHSLVSAPLGHHHNTADLLHLRVIWRAHPVQVSCNLEMKGSETILSTNSECQNFFPFPRKRWFFKIQFKNLWGRSSGYLFKMLHTNLISNCSQDLGESNLGHYVWWQVPLPSEPQTS